MFNLFKSSKRVAEFFGSVRRNDFCAKFVVCIFSIAEDLFSLDRFSALPAGFFHGFLKSSDLVSEFFGSVRRNDFCPKIVVCILSITENLFPFDRISVLPVDLLA